MLSETFGLFIEINSSFGIYAGVISDAFFGRMAKLINKGARNSEVSLLESLMSPHFTQSFAKFSTRNSQIWELFLVRHFDSP